LLKNALYEIFLPAIGKIDKTTARLLTQSGIKTRFG
jgi:hypothetical protein